MQAISFECYLPVETSHLSLLVGTVGHVLATP